VKKGDKFANIFYLHDSTSAVPHFSPYISRVCVFAESGEKIYAIKIYCQRF
jgi:hypothetical protein